MVYSRYTVFHQVQAGTDPGFPVGGGADPLSANIQFYHIFQKNCIKLRKSQSVKGGGGCEARTRGVPLDPPMAVTQQEIWCWW